MFKTRPYTERDVLQGDVYPELGFYSANLTQSAVENHTQALRVQLASGVSQKWGMVVSHSCDVNDKTGRPSDRVLIAEVLEFSPYTREIVERRGNGPPECYRMINSMDPPKPGERLFFPNIFYLEPHPDLGGHDHWVDFSTIRAIERSRLNPARKLVELDEDGGTRLRFKLATNFSRGVDG